MPIVITLLQERKEHGSRNIVEHAVCAGKLYCVTESEGMHFRILDYFRSSYWLARSLCYFYVPYSSIHRVHTMDPIWTRFQPLVYCSRVLLPEGLALSLLGAPFDCWTRILNIGWMSVALCSSSVANSPTEGRGS
jgi:hypothetical protein